MVENHIEAENVYDEWTHHRWVIAVQLPGHQSIGRPSYINKGPEAEVEFYDAEQDANVFPPFGQFAGSYRITTLVDSLSNPEAGGLNLCFGVPAWKVSRDVVVAAVRHCVDVLHLTV